MSNRTIADWLTDYAHFLESRGASLYRIRAYRQAAETVLSLDREAAEIVSERGRKGLAKLPGIGRHLAYTVEQLILTGEFRTLDREESRPVRQSAEQSIS